MAKDGEAVAELIDWLKTLGIKADAKPVYDLEYCFDYEIILGWLSYGSDIRRRVC